MSQEQLDELRQLYPSVSVDVVSRCLSVAHAVLAKESKQLGLPDFPVHLLHAVLAVLVNIYMYYVLENHIFS